MDDVGMLCSGLTLDQGPQPPKDVPLGPGACPWIGETQKGGGG